MAVAEVTRRITKRITMIHIAGSRITLWRRRADENVQVMVAGSPRVVPLQLQANLLMQYLRMLSRWRVVFEQARRSECQGEKAAGLRMREDSGGTWRQRGSVSHTSIRTRVRSTRDARNTGSETLRLGSPALELHWWTQGRLLLPVSPEV